MSLATFDVNGSYGNLTVDGQTGRVVGYDPQCDEPVYDDVARFNIAEFERQYGCHIVDAEAVDILDIGFWLKTGEYFPPHEDYRDPSSISVRVDAEN